MWWPRAASAPTPRPPCILAELRRRRRSWLAQNTKPSTSHRIKRPPPPADRVIAPVTVASASRRAAPRVDQSAFLAAPPHHHQIRPWRPLARISLRVQVCQGSTVQAQGRRGCTHLAMGHRPEPRRQSACREFLVVQPRLRLAAQPNACEYARVLVRACMCLNVGCAAPAGETAQKTMQHRPLEHMRASAPARGANADPLTTRPC